MSSANRQDPLKILPITSAEHREFVEQNYPLVEANTAIEFPRPMPYRDGSSSKIQYFHSALVDCVTKQFANGHAHTVFLSVLENKETGEMLTTDDGRRPAQMELHVFGFVGTK